MTYDHELILISKTWEKDEYGNMRPVETRTAILCKVKSIGRSEFYSAAMADLRPEIVFVIHACEYGSEQEVEFDGEKYRVIRTYKGDATRMRSKLALDEMELTCGRVIADD